MPRRSHVRLVMLGTFVGLGMEGKYDLGHVECGKIYDDFVYVTDHELGLQFIGILIDVP